MRLWALRWAALGALWLGACVLGVGLGAHRIPPVALAQLVGEALGLGPAPAGLETSAAVLWTLRLPRVALGAAVGAALGAAGATMQGVFRNPLADPGVVGVSSGGALFAAASMALPWAALPLPAPLLELLRVIGVPGAAFVGSALATTLALGLGRDGRRTDVAELLLVGVAVNAVCGAGLGLIIALAQEAQLRSLSAWMLGGLGGATAPLLAVTLPLCLMAAAAPVLLAPSLNALALGEPAAAQLGVAVERVKRAGVGLAALGVGASVAAAGMIGFVGLVVPHLVRLALGPDHRQALPASALLGSALLVGADLAARLLIAPVELPVGVLTTLMGGPLFLSLLLRARRLRGAA